MREELPDGHLVVRTAWLYGAHGGCFPQDDRPGGPRAGPGQRRGRPGRPAHLDRRRRRRWSSRWSQADAPAGTYHATSSGRCSWFDFAQRVVVAAGLESSTVQPTTSDAFVRPAPRPAYSVLGHDALTGLGVEPIGDWEARWAEAAALGAGLTRSPSPAVPDLAGRQRAQVDSGCRAPGGGGTRRAGGRCRGRSAPPAAPRRADGGCRTRRRAARSPRPRRCRG